MGKAQRTATCRSEFRRGTIGPPLAFGASCEFASLFVLREIEASFLFARSVSFCMREEAVCTKHGLDPSAFSCGRTWGFVCGGILALACAFHVVCRRHHTLLVMFGIVNSLPCDFPFFPSIDGKLEDKVSVVECVGKVAPRLNLTLTGHDGRHAFGNHFFHISGASFCCRGYRSQRHRGPLTLAIRCEPAVC